MKRTNRMRWMNVALVLTGALLIPTAPVLAQDYAPPVSYAAGQLDTLVNRIALYPDPLLAQIFAAAAFPDQIADAARWADQYRNLTGQQLADTIAQANLPFDPAVQALLPFPTVLDMMASDPNWTRALSDAVMNNEAAVMDAIQQLRRTAEQYGYLQDNGQMQVVDNGGEVEIEPVDAGLMYVPVYDPYVVFARPRPGFFVGGAIHFGGGVAVGGFTRWGWGSGRFDWRGHSAVVNHQVWNRPVHVYESAPATRFNQTPNYRQNTTRENFNRVAPAPVPQAPAVTTRGFERRAPERTVAPPVEQQRSFVPQQQRNFTAPQQQQRNFAAPAPQQRSFTAPQQQQRSFSPPARNEGGHAEQSHGRR